MAGHEVGDEAQVPGVDCNPIGSKHRPNLMDNSCSGSFHPKGVEHRSDVVGGDVVEVDDVAVGPGCPKVEAISLNLGPRASRLV